jgi:hypothetical protein
MFTNPRLKSNYDEIFISELPLTYKQLKCYNNRNINTANKNVNNNNNNNSYLKLLNTNFNSNEKYKILSKYYDDR